MSYIINTYTRHDDSLSVAKLWLLKTGAPVTVKIHIGDMKAVKKRQRHCILVYYVDLATGF